MTTSDRVLFWLAHHEPTKIGPFMCDELGLTRDEIDRAIAELVRLGYIEVIEPKAPVD